MSLSTRDNKIPNTTYERRAKRPRYGDELTLSPWDNGGRKHLPVLIMNDWFLNNALIRGDTYWEARISSDNISQGLEGGGGGS